MFSSYGDDAKFGTITSSEEYYFSWRTIYPNDTPYIDATTGKHRKQETLVQGMLHPRNLLDITRNFSIFMDISKHILYKALCLLKILKHAKCIDCPFSQT
ncbi:MAG: hypothetical protein JKX98_12025 [Alcanivoracaceae bacterium]|nr:hypothetical protein [Alcanivoracaceae bacterium]